MSPPNIPAIAIQGEGYNISQSALNSLKERYKNIFDNMDCAVGVLKTPNGKNFYFIEWNKKAIELEKKHINNVIGKELYEIFPEYEKDGLKDCLKQKYFKHI